MERADVIIVGGGPAGSSCARELIAAGLDVIVLDRAIFPREKTCAGWITPAVVDLLDLNLERYGSKRICQPITGFRTSIMEGEGLSPRHDVVETAFGEPVSYGICRVQFDDYLLQRSGARVFEHTPVTALSRDNGRWIVNDVFEAPMLVGAGGHQCPVAKHLGARPNAESAVVAQEVEFRMTPAQSVQCRVKDEIPELYFCEDLRGYGWVFRKGDVLNVGLGRHDPHDLRSSVREFVQRLIAAGAMPGDVKSTMKGHAYLLRDTSGRPLVDDGVVLAGDSAGLAATMSGEGIRPAIESGLIAAATILEARPDYSRLRLEKYAERVNERFPRMKHPKLGAIAASIVRPMIGQLFESRWFTRNYVLERWFLQAA